MLLGIGGELVDEQGKGKSTIGVEDNGRPFETIS